MTAEIQIALVTLAQSDGAGRGDNPSDAGGILIIVGMIVLAAIVIGSACYMLARSTARRRGARGREPGREG